MKDSTKVLTKLEKVLTRPEKSSRLVLKQSKTDQKTFWKKLKTNFMMPNMLSKIDSMKKFGKLNKVFMMLRKVLRMLLMISRLSLTNLETEFSTQKTLHQKV